MSYVFVVDQSRRSLDPAHPGRARFLLTAGHAAVLRRYPFTIIMKEANPDLPITPLRLKIDPDSRTTGLAIVHDATGDVVWAAELTHRGGQIKEHLDQRRRCPRSRRQRHTRYRQARWANRRRRKGWLPPSLQSRVENVMTWVERLWRWCPIGTISLEVIRFDMQALQHPEIRGVEYQHGTLHGYEVREYRAMCKSLITSGEV
jgi:hypothetical protein